MRYGGAPKRDTLLQALHSMWVGRKRRLSGFVDFLLEGVTFPVGSFSSNALSFILVVLLTCWLVGFIFLEKMWGNSVGNSWEIFKFVVIKFGMLTAVTWKIYGRCS